MPFFTGGQHAISMFVLQAVNIWMLRLIWALQEKWGENNIRTGDM